VKFNQAHFFERVCQHHVFTSKHPLYLLTDVYASSNNILSILHIKGSVLISIILY